MSRTLIALGTLAGLFTSTLPLYMKVRKNDKEGRNDESYEEITKRLHSLIPVFNKSAGIELDVKGVENIPDGPVLYVSNHQGIYDPVALMETMKTVPGFFAKKEVENVPIMSAWMRELGCVFIDREDPSKALGEINKGVEQLKKGRSLAVFPEGTRSRSRDIGEFKGGAFIMAQRAKVPIVPVAMDGSYLLWENNNNKIKPCKIYKSSETDLRRRQNAEKGIQAYYRSGQEKNSDRT